MNNLKILKDNSDIDQAIKTCQQNSNYIIILALMTQNSFDYYTSILKEKLTFTNNRFVRNELSCRFNNGSILELNILPFSKRAHQIYYESSMNEETLRYIVAPCIMHYKNKI